MDPPTMFLPLSLLSTLSLVSSFPLESRQSNTSDSGGSSADPCAALINSGTYLVPSSIKTCLTSIPFREDVRQNIMTSVTAFNTLNVFQYNQLGNDNPVFNQGVDLRKEFERINNTDYSSDYEFQYDLSKTVNSLNDGHYYWQSCYTTAFSTSSYIPIVALQNGDDGQTAIYLAPNLPIYAGQNGLSDDFASNGFNLSDLAGAQVLSIEGKSPWDYLDQVSGVEGGQFQDPEQRLNYQFASYTSIYGGVGIIPGDFTQTTSFDKDEVKMTVKTSSGQEMDISSPWLSTYRGGGGWNFQSGEEFYNATCLFQAGSGSSEQGQEGGSTANGTEATPPTQETNTTEPDTGSGPIDVNSLISEAYMGCPSVPTTPKYRYENPPVEDSSYLGGRDIQFYALGDDKKTGVIYVPTFAPVDSQTGASSDACTERWVVDLYLGFKNFTQAGVEKILIDTSSNAGGQVVLNQFFQRYITGEEFEVDLNFDTLLRKSPLAQGLLAANIKNGNDDTSGNIFNPGKYRNGTSILAAGTDIFSPGNSYTINGETLETSNELMDDIQTIDEYEGPLNISDTPPYSPSDIVFTGNGLCGSACSSFTNFLIEYYNATAYIAAGRPQNPIEFQAYAAGQATSSEDILKEAVSVNYTDYATLPPLGVIGKFGFAIRGAISPNIAPGTFLQYRSYPAQHTYGLTAEQFLDPIKNWKYVASQVFG